MVARECEARRIDHFALTPLMASRGNLQANARAARYAALGEWATTRGLGAVITAHHRDDQAETLLMRLNRGAGARGLAGMRPASAIPGYPALPLLRPLLGWSRLELAQIVEQAGLAAARDPSNGDTRFERVRVRHLLAETSWFDPAAMASSAAHLAEADSVIEWAAENEWMTRVERFGDALVYRPIAPQAVRLRVLERILAELGQEGDPRGSEIARLAGRLDAGGIATLGGVRAASADGAWRFTSAPPRQGLTKF